LRSIVLNRPVSPPVLASETVWDVMIRCHDTGTPVETCLVFELDSWAEVDLPPQILVCPACSRRHRWEKADAWLHKERRHGRAGG
jgi:hypothetical protein